MHVTYHVFCRFSGFRGCNGNFVRDRNRGLPRKSVPYHTSHTTSMSWRSRVVSLQVCCLRTLCVARWWQVLDMYIRTAVNNKCKKDAGVNPRVLLYLCSFGDRS